MELNRTQVESATDGACSAAVSLNGEQVASDTEVACNTTESKPLESSPSKASSGDGVSPKRQGPQRVSVVEQPPLQPMSGEQQPQVSSSSSSRAKPGRRGMVIELCAGSAMLSRCFHEQGFVVMPVDHKQNRFHPLAKICNLSLTDESSWKYLFWLLDNEHIVYCHMAPPCGTCSRARELPGGPPPLRNEAFPWGFDDLDTQQRARVDAANAIYIGMAKFIEALIDRGIFFAVENPRNSLIWSLPIWKKIMKAAFFITFDACVYGGLRKTAKSFLTNVETLRAMEQRCNGGHSHLPFGRTKIAPGKYAYATAEEAAYPRPLCLQIVAQITLALGLTPILQDEFSTPARAFAGSLRLPRGRKVPPLISEFAGIHVLTLNQLPTVDSKRCITSQLQFLPPGAKFLSHVLVKSGADGDETNPKFQCTFGVFHTQEMFVQKALRLSHPFDSLCPLKDVFLRVLFKMITGGPFLVMKHRSDMLKKWLAWAGELSAAEKQLHLSLEAGVEQVLAKKRILLLEKLAESVGWEDREIFKLMKRGFDLVGTTPSSGVFDVEHKPAELSLAGLESSRKFMRPALLSKVLQTQVDDDHVELWEKTCKEAESPLLSGPYTPEEVDEIFPEGWMPVRRFGVRQSSGDSTKLRPIDDYSECKVNLAFGYCDKIDLRALDELIWVLRAWTTWVINRGTCEVTLNTGEVLSGSVHEAWQETTAAPMLSTMDLHAAYKQLPLSPSARAMSVVVLLNPITKSAGCFIGRALPFGSTASVVFFNRIARLIWRLGIELMLPWCNYYDDYPIFTPSCLEQSTMTTMVTLLNLLGFEFATDKLKQFSSEATMLGVEVDCGGWTTSNIVVRNKESRSKELAEFVKDLRVGGKLTTKQFLRVVGRLQFAEAQVMGRMGKLALSRIRGWMDHKEVVVDQTLIDELAMLVERLRRARPRTVPGISLEMPILIFTDGASEADVHTVGGVLIFPSSSTPRFFGCSVPDKLTTQWFGEMKHIIGPVEAYAVLVARKVWHQFVVGNRCIYFIDNFGAMDAFIKGSSTSRDFREILLGFERQECNGLHWPWFSRVPSPSNCADDPSRIGAVKCDTLLNSVRDSCWCPLTGARLLDIGT